MTPPDLTNFGCVHAKELETHTVHGAWLNGAASPVILDSGDSTDATDNCTNKIQLALTYVVAGDSTMDITQLPADDPAVENITIGGVAGPTLPYQAANKKYVDDQTTALFSIHPQVDATSNGDISGAPVFTYTANSAAGTPPSTIDLRLGIGGTEGEWATGALNTNVVVDGVTVDVGKRIFLHDSQGGANGNRSDGIYVITSIANITFDIVLTRADDAKVFAPPHDSEFLVGEYVIAAAGTLNAGKGYVLSEEVVLPTGDQKWYLFSTHQFLGFTAPIVFRSGKWTIAGADESAPGAGDSVDEGKVLLSDSANCTWDYAFGKSTAACTLEGEEIRINDSSKSVYDVTGTFIVAAPHFKLVSSTINILNSTGDTLTSAATTNRFAKVLAGTVPQVGGVPTISTVATDGHIMPTTTGFANTDDKFGAGVFFDSAVDFTGGGTNSNGSRFLVAPHNHLADNSSSLDIIGFQDSVSGSGAIIIAQIEP